MTTQIELAQALKSELSQINIEFYVNGSTVRMFSPNDLHLGNVVAGNFELGKGFGAFIGRKESIGEKIEKATPILIALCGLLTENTTLSALLPIVAEIAPTKQAITEAPAHFAGAKITYDRYGMMNQGKGSAGLEWALSNGLI